MKRGVVIGGLTLLFAASVLVVEATEYSSTNFLIRDPVISVGGGRATSTGFQVYSSLGQTAIGESTSTDFTLRSGFLYYPEPEEPVGRRHGEDEGGAAIGQPVTREIIITFSGKAYPRSQVTLLKDAQFAATTLAGPDAKFSISLRNLSAGNYIFGFRAQDRQGERSLLQTYPVTFNPQTPVELRGITIAPTLTLDKSEVRKGDSITISGQSIPHSTVNIIIGSKHELRRSTQADNEGNYSYNFDTAPLALGKHVAKAWSSSLNEGSPFSKLVSFLVGTKNVATLKIDEAARKSDVNGDGNVSLVDLSILIYWYGQQAGAPFPPALDLNSDGKIDLVDFSIMSFYWTG